MTSPGLPTSDPESSTSPTPTIRNISASTVTSGMEIFDEPTPGTVDDNTSENRKVSGARAQQDLGKGRPGASELRRPSPLRPGTSPNLSIHNPSLSPSRSVSTTYETEDDSAYPSSNTTPYRQYAMTANPNTSSFLHTGDQTPRLGASGSQRGNTLPYPQTASALGSSFGSPNPNLNRAIPSGGSVPRPARAGRYNTSTVLPIVGGSGSMSRSASRTRPALSTHNTGVVGVVPKVKEVKGKDEDDEVEVEDRGQALIRRRQKERKQLRRAKERERERRIAEDGEDGLGGPSPEASAPPTAGLEDNPQHATYHSQIRSIGRSASTTRSRTASADRRGGDMGYFTGHERMQSNYAGSVAGDETPRMEGRGSTSPKDEFGMAGSMYSSYTEDEADGAREREERASIVGDVVQEVIDEVEEPEEEQEDEEEDSAEGDDEGLTLKDRQDAINIEHPFGLPIWKPALYRKSRSVTRNAEIALHSIPSAAAQRHLLPGNLAWVVLFGWWLAILFTIVAGLVSGAEVLGGGRGGYGKTLRGLAWYIFWPFGKYVEGEGAPDGDESDEEGDYGAVGEGLPTTLSGGRQREPSDSSGVTVRAPKTPNDHLEPEVTETIPMPQDSNAVLQVDNNSSRREHVVCFAPSITIKGKARDADPERAPLLIKRSHSPSPGYFRRPRNKRAKMLGRLVYWPLFVLVVAPVMLFVCILCWGGVITIPMAKLTWALLELLAKRPLEINFRSAPKVQVPITPSPSSSPGTPSGAESGDTTLAGGSSNEPLNGSPGGYTIKRAHLKAGQLAPTSGPRSTVLLCTYRAVGLQYYKYTVGGVNIMFINLLPLVFFTIIDAFILLPIVEHSKSEPSPFIAFITSQALLFILALSSVIPLSYFIGMAVASISAQSSIGMGAVINATFGSVIEVILYGIALTQGKGRLVEGSIVGSILAGVLLMPGASMCSGALKRKEQKFNAKSAGVTSTMLIMAIIGTLTPTMFYQTYGSFELHCEGFPDTPIPGKSTVPAQRTGQDWLNATAEFTAQQAWECNNCYYEHPDPASDPFYQDQVKTLMYACAAILLFSYLIGLWFSLRTHASQIWQNPQQLMKPEDPLHPTQLPHAIRNTLLNPQTRGISPSTALSHVLPLYSAHTRPQRSGTASPSLPPRNTHDLNIPGHGHGHGRSVSSGYNLPAGYTPFLESIKQDTVQRGDREGLTPMRLPSALTTEDFTRAVAVATVSALRHQGSIVGHHSQHGKRERVEGGVKEGGGGHGEEEGEGGGHEAPSWNRGVSAGVLLGCTVLYAIIAEILVDVVDVVLAGSGIDEKFLGLTLFALVPNTTEFMNAVSFAMNGNIALSMEIGSAYALQVCLLQIPAMVAFSAFYDPGKMGEVVDTFTWDVIAIILSIFLLTYTYIEARSNYHRGSILVLAYVVLVMGFYYAPARDQSQDDLVLGNAEGLRMGLQVGLSKLWA